MFWNTDQKKKTMEFIQSYVPTSKAQLLQVSMFLSGGDINKAQEYFDFYSKNLSLPDFDPVAPTWQQNTANTVNGIMDWLKNNQDTLVQGYQFVQTIIENRGVLPALSTAAAAEEAIAPINEE